MVTIDEARQSAKTGSAVALAERHYALIEAEDGPSGKDIHSFLALSRERALAQAERVDALHAKGDEAGTLAGVPIGVKDVLTMTGTPATAGSKILAGYMPPYDATAVKKLEAAGAVLLGKLNCDEFAMGSSNENSAYGPVRNPARVGSRSGRIIRRQRGGGCGGLLRGFAGHGYGRVDPAAGSLLRRGRRTANLRPRQPLRPDRVWLVA